MLEHKRNGKIAFMLMDKLIVYDKPPDTDRRETGNIANVPDQGNVSDSHANGSSKIKQNYYSFSRPNVCLAWLQMELCWAANIFAAAKIKSQYFKTSLKFL